MRIEIRFTPEEYEGLNQHLLQSDGMERAAYLFAGPNIGPDHLILGVREVWPVPQEAYARQSAGGIEVKAGYIKRVLSHARETGLSLLETHSHPFSEEGVAFSHIDLGDEAQKFPYVAAKIPHISHGTMVFGHRSVDAHLCHPRWRTVIPVERVTVLGVPLATLTPTSVRQWLCWERNYDRTAIVDLDGERYRRQVQAFGPEGQAALGRVHVGLVGLGSVGMLWAQQLAYLGVRHFTLVDPDVVEASNLNRLVGATPRDAERRTRKVRVAARLVRSIAPEAQVQALPVSLLEAQAQRALKGVDVLVGGTDNHSSRLVLNDRLAVQYLIPYIDTGTGIETDGTGQITRAGGWVRLVLPGQWCLQCIDGVNREQAALELLSPQEREQARARGYIADADVPAPSVLFLNSTLVSLAVAEFMNLVTGFKAPHTLLLYDLLKQRVLPVSAERRADCPACSPEGLLGWGDLEPFPVYEVESDVPMLTENANGKEPKDAVASLLPAHEVA